MKKKIRKSENRVLCVILFAIMLLTPLQSLAAATTMTSEPYATVDFYNYVTNVQPGHIRAITQNPDNSMFVDSYWGQWKYASMNSAGIKAKSECGTTCISMALSYIGINITPKDILNYSTSTTFCKSWGGASYDTTSSFDTMMNRYLNNSTSGIYSPPIIHLDNYSTDGHFVCMIGKSSSTSYVALDPWTGTTFNMTIVKNGSTYTLSYKGKTESTSFTYSSKANTLKCQYYNPSASLVKGEWKQENGLWYYYIDGEYVTGWVKVGTKWYYMYEDGVMASNTWIGSYYVGTDGAWIENYEPEGWRKDSKGWWYRYVDGSYPANTWKYIDEQWYYFNAKGYMVTGWKQISGIWYYFYSNGAMASDTWIGNYYVNNDGKWLVNYEPEGWRKNSKGWWYRYVDGSYPYACWMEIDGILYYFNDKGYMAAGWERIDTIWYYFKSSGEMTTSEWVGNYYLKEDGTMAVSEWVDGDTYYVDENGVWVPNKQKDSGDTDQETEADMTGQEIAKEIG